MHSWTRSSCAAHVSMLQMSASVAMIKAAVRVLAGDPACCAHVSEARQAACNRWQRGRADTTGKAIQDF